MKKIFCIMLFMSVFFIFSCQTMAVTIVPEDLKGDSEFINKIMELQTNDDTIVPDALYVSAEGSDGNKGTIDSPYATVYYALSKAAAGQTIYIREGNYNQNITITKSGTAGKYITIRNYPGEKPVFDHSSFSEDGGAIVHFSNADYIQIQGLTLCNKNLKAKSGYGILMNKGNHIIIKNIEIYDINVPDPTSGAVCSNAVILYGNDGSVPISNVLIDSCYIHDCQTGWSEGVSVNGNSEYVNFINNRIDNIGNIGLDFAGHFNACKDESLDQARYCTAIGNVVSRCVSPNAVSYGLYNDGGRNNTFDRNIVYQCSGGIEIGSEEGGAYPSYPVKDIVVKNNLIYDNIEAGLSIGGYDNSATGIVYNTCVYNNTLINNGNAYGGKELGINKTNGIDIRNNIFYKNDTGEIIKIRFDESLAGGITFAANCYFSSKSADDMKISRYGVTTTGFDNWKNVSGETGIYADPEFSENYSLDAHSPCIDNGDNIAGIGEYDIANNTRVINNLDMGCYEFQNGNVTTAVTAESTTECTTLYLSSSTEQTTEGETVSAASSVWDFTDSRWADKTERNTVYTVNGLTVRHNGGGSGINGFKFDKNEKSPATGGYYIRLSANEGDKITVYININSSKEGKTTTLTLAELKDGATKPVDSKTIEAVKNGVFYIEFDISCYGDYVIYTDGTADNTAYYSKVVLEKQTLKGDVNSDGVVNGSDAAIILKYCADIESEVNGDFGKMGDVNSDGKVDLSDVIIILNSF
ncbi:MAG: dockerin type I domain-containing protein [Clostridia bacterium]|nr:dockerin type I domain-containing protein [Clostridia bacterium]